MEIKTLSELQADFKKAIDQSSDKSHLLENELREINNFISYTPIPKQSKGKFFQKYYPAPQKTGIFNIDIDQFHRPAFSKAFNSCVVSGENLIKKSHHEPEEAFQVRKQISEQAKEFYHYYLWLIDLKENKKPKKQSTLTHKQKLLALYYFGLDMSKYDNSKTAKILSQILELSEDNTRQYLSYLTAGKNNVRTKSNLEKVYQLFEVQELNTISTIIKKDLEKL